MVSCDTPEKAPYAGKPEVSQPKLDKCKERLEGGFYNTIPEGLRIYFTERLTNDASHKHISAANDATTTFKDLLEQRLTKPSGSKHKTAIIAPVK
jgi:hypothetical protein